ncbi:Zinc finger, Dof-type [Dillenia turbinata]|uniref:Zinc finger, Dof-type n=1 Tax=Dillenia turbinata TaxID=194707 RepID=A0AAN8V1V4_9MAGN
MDTAQWPEGIGVGKPMEGSTKSMLEKKAIRPHKDQALNCPRYWTEGGSLRNVPVGGGSRKNKRSSSSSPLISSKKLDSSHDHLMMSNPNKSTLIHEGQDLNLAFPPPSHEDYNTISKFAQLVPFNDLKSQSSMQNPSSCSSSAATTTTSQFSAMELLKGGMTSRGLMASLMPVSGDSSTIYSSSSSSTGFQLHEFKPTLNFSLEGFDNGYGNLQLGVQDNNGARLLFPFEDLRQVSTSNGGGEFDEQNRSSSAGQGGGEESNGYWNGVLGGGTSCLLLY